VVKLHEDGDIVWEKSFGGPGVENAYAIEDTVDGGFIVAGVTDSFGAGGQDIWVVKLASDGTVEWEKSYGDVGADIAYDIKQTVDQGYVIAGGSSDEALVLKLNQDGTIGWQKTYGDDPGTDLDEAYAIAQTADGGYIVVGITDPAGAWNADIRVLKLLADGTVAWQNDYGDAGDDRGYAISETVDGGYIVAGSTSSFGAGGFDTWLLKLDSNGAVTWQKAYGETGDEEARAVQETVQGGYILAGSTSSFGRGNRDIWIVGLNTDGSVAWEKTYGQTEDDTGLDVQLTSDGGYINCGATESMGDGSPGFADMWILRDDDGVIDGCNPMETGHIVAVADTSVLPAAASVLTQAGSLTQSDTAGVSQQTSANSALPCNESVKPLAYFTADPVDGQNPLTVQFTDTSTGLITSYLWDFGDDSFSSEQNPVHKFKGIDTYTIKLTVTGPAGSNMEREFDYINVTEGLPIADFKATPTVGTPPFVVEFTGKPSSEKWGSITTYFWAFGDGSTAWGEVAYHYYTSGGPFTVSLTATGPGGADTKTKVDLIHEPGYLPLYPVIEARNPRKAYPGDKIAIKGYNFGAEQGNSIVHINGKTFDSSSPRIRLWSDTKVKIKLPGEVAYDCDWFKGEAYRNRSVWITVEGEDSNKKRVKVLKPDTCP
jgi:PKD repeat protein/predicted secreted protein